MSLKAKIEAVIYASEEPVTLAQLMGLLGEEAQAELNALAARQQSLALDERPSEPPAGDEEALNAEILEASEDEAPMEDPSEEAGTPETAGESESSDPTPNPSFRRESAPLADAGERPAVGTTGDPGGPGPDSRTREAAPQIPEATPSSKELAAEARLRERALREYFRSLIAALISDYASNDRGLEIREVAGGFRLATKPEYHDAVRGFVKSLKPPLKLTLQALETLAVVAYKQPVTAPEISEIRGVDSGGVLGSLITRKLITTAGRKQVIGRPILYKTTKDFLVRFGLKDINELPSIEEFEKMAGELNDAVQEEIPMDDAPATNPSEEAVSAGTPTSLDETNSAPEPTTQLHESVEDIMSDDSTQPEGHKHEPGHQPILPDQVEPIGDTHTPQADGIPDEDSPVPSADDIIVDGRQSGLPPDYSGDEADDPSAQEALEQEKEEDLKTSTPG